MSEEILLPLPTPMDPNIQLSDTEGELVADPSQYRRLMYLTISQS